MIKLLYNLHRNILIFFSRIFAARAPTQLTHLTKHRVEVPGTRRPPKQLFKQRSMDDMEKIEQETSLEFQNGSHSASTENNSYLLKYSSMGKTTDISGEQRQLLDSLDLHSPDSQTVKNTRKKVGEYFKKVKRMQDREPEQTVKSSETLSSAIAKDSLVLLKPKVYHETLSPKLRAKLPKSQTKSPVSGKSDIHRYKPNLLHDKGRKSPRKDLDMPHGMSPQPRPLQLISGHGSQEMLRLSSYDNTSMSVMDQSDTDDEIMV